VIAVKADYELLEGNGTSAFQTPLGTNHAFQGWADRFLITPADGIEALYGTVAASVYGPSLVVVYHDFSADNDGYDYGTEWDAQLSKTFWEHYTLGLTYATNKANANVVYLTRNGPASMGKQAFDLDKAWVWIEMKF
jgi:hypothetical protein